MDDLLSATQGDRMQQQRVSDITLRALKEISPSLPKQTKNLVSLKKALQGDGDWKTTKEILGWIVNTDEGTLIISPKRKEELGTLLDIPPLQRRMSTKKLERLIGKLRSMHLAVPGTVGHFYNLQQSLTAAHHAHQATAYVTKGFHSDLRFWRRLCADMPTRSTYLAKIVQRLPTDIGFADASGLGAEGVWIYPNKDGLNYVWRLPCPEDIRTDLVSFENPQGRITNSDLELAALVLQEATSPSYAPVRLGAPRSLDATTLVPLPGTSGNPPPSTLWWRTSSEFGPW